MSTGPTATSAAWVRGVLRMFESQGVDSARLLQAAEIDPALLEDPHGRLELEAVNRLWRLAVAASGQETLGLDRALASRYLDLEIAANWIGSDATLGSVLQSQASYAALTNDASAFTLEPEHPNVWLALTHGNDRAYPRQRIEYAMLATVLVMQRITRCLLRPLAAEFVFPEPADAHRHRMAFPCPLRFDRPANRLLLAGEDLELPVVSGSASVFVVEERVLESLLADLGTARTSFRVAQELVGRLRKGEFQSQSLAAALGLSDTQLARQLRAERTSLEDLLDRVRRELAHEYLAASDAPLAEMPGWLGLRDAAEFAAAVRRWFGTTPADYRRHHGPDRPRA
ncbi:AraC family transcriptional regulator [Caenimonas terrae]|uniref:AraC family transcriptional regulator n=1 Tax=Caenimonas terrae TaxID=696074 RepID=A0ABW0NL40_9BURK